MKRFFILFVALSLTGISLTANRNAHASGDTTPPIGSWSWCTSSNTNGCIEEVTTISPEKVETTYTSASQLPAGLMVNATCSPNGPVNTCDSNRYYAREDGQCAERPTWGNRVITPSIEFNVGWDGKIGWSVRIRLSTGNFRPAFTIGHGTRAIKISADGDGTYTYTNTLLLEKTYSATVPANIIALTGTPQYFPAHSEWLKTAVADSSRDLVNAQVWPRDHLLKPNATATPGIGSITTTAPISTTATGCRYYPFEGAWAEANASGFSWSYSVGSTSANAPNVLKFNAHAPHYLPQVSNQPLEIMPARVQVFMPSSYFEALGYTSLSEFNSSSYSVTTEDGQPTTPSLSIKEDGILINLGVQHYSAPNPSITITPKDIATGSTNSLPPSTVAPAVASPSTPKLLRALSRRKSAPLTSFLTTTLKGTKSWRVSGGCLIAQSRLRAPSKKSTCTLTLTVRNSQKKVVATKTARIKIS